MKFNFSGSVVSEQGVVRSTGKCDLPGGNTGVGGMTMPIKDEDDDVSGSDGEVSKIDFTGMFSGERHFCFSSVILNMVAEIRTAGFTFALLLLHQLSSAL
jgi:hypothetical protein